MHIESTRYALSIRHDITLAAGGPRASVRAKATGSTQGWGVACTSACAAIVRAPKSAADDAPRLAPRHLNLNERQALRVGLALQSKDIHHPEDLQDSARLGILKQVLCSHVNSSNCSKTLDAYEDATRPSDAPLPRVTPAWRVGPMPAQSCNVSLIFSAGKHGTCAHGLSFGCASARNMWTSTGCRGIFRCASRTIKCGYTLSPKQECECAPFRFVESLTAAPSRSECAARKTTVQVNLSECINLAPAGTGTTTLTDLMKRVAKAPNHHHYHEVRAGQVGHASPPFAGKAPKRHPCFVTTIRDPVARLHSAWTYRLTQGRRHHFDVGLRHKHTLSEYVQTLRNTTSDAWCGEPEGAPSSLLAGVRPYSCGSPELYGRPAFSSRVEVNGSMRWITPNEMDPFEAAQAHWLCGLDCAEDELHFICTESFQSDWEAVMLAFNGSGTSEESAGGSAAGDAAPEVPLAAVPHLNKHRARSRPCEAERSCLSAEEERWVRECLYPMDAHLHQQICSASAW